MRANAARVWLFFDGRSGPYFDPNEYNTVIGLEQPLRSQVGSQHLLNLSLMAITCFFALFSDLRIR